MALSKHTMMSPGAVALQVNTVYGTTVIDKFGILDPTRAEKQLNAKLGTSVFHKNGPLDRGINDPHWTPDGLAAALGI